MRNTDEPELIARSLDGDTEAYGLLVGRYKNAIYRHCFAMVRDEDAAEDMAQETFIAAYYHLKKYNNAYKFSTWLFKISTNKCLDCIRRKTKEVRADEKALDSVASDHPTPHKTAEAHEVRDAVDRLQPKYRAVVSLYYWQGLEYKDIALAMDSPLNSVRVWLLRAKEQLRKELS